MYLINNYLYFYYRYTFIDVGFVKLTVKILISFERKLLLTTICHMRTVTIVDCIFSVLCSFICNRTSNTSNALNDKIMILSFFHLSRF